MSHRAHGDIHTDGLADDCLGCAEIAENPFANADEEIMQSLARQALVRAQGHPMPPRTETELVAVTTVLNVFERMGRVTEVAPKVVEEYLRDRWHIEVDVLETAYTRARARAALGVVH